MQGDKTWIHIHSDGRTGWAVGKPSIILENNSRFPLNKAPVGDGLQSVIIDSSVKITWKIIDETPKEVSCDLKYRTAKYGVGKDSQLIIPGVKISDSVNFEAIWNPVQAGVDVSEDIFYEIACSDQYHKFWRTKFYEAYSYLPWWKRLVNMWQSLTTLDK